MAKIKETEGEVSQRFKYSDFVGNNKELSSVVKNQIQQDTIDFILKRTDNGQDLNERGFKSYSPEYKSSLQFKAFGKSSKVNMKLRGIMLRSMDVIEDDGEEFKIGFRGRTENAKAYNHQTGDTLPKRKFFGLRSKDVKNIGMSYDVEEKLTPEEKAAGLDENNTSALDVLSFLNKASTIKGLDFLGKLL